MAGQASSRTTRSHAGVLEGIERCRSIAGDADAFAARAEKVSAWSVGQQLEHLLLADESIVRRVERLQAEGAAPAGGRPTFAGYVVLISGSIPRGRGRAPDFTLPADLAAREIGDRFDAGAERYDALRPALAELEALRATGAHPILGHFTAARWLRFAHVHHGHHEEIVRDILAGANRA